MNYDEGGQRSGEKGCYWIATGNYPSLKHTYILQQARKVNPRNDLNSQWHQVVITKRRKGAISSIRSLPQKFLLSLSRTE